MEKDMNSLSEYIAKKLKEKGLSERELAKRCSVSHAYINQLIKGVNPSTNKKISPTVKTIEKLAKGLEVPTDTLEKIARGIPEDQANQLKPSGIPVGSRGDRLIPLEVWEEIKQANNILGSLGVDPSEISDENWEKLLEDIRLVIKIHTTRWHD